MPEFYKIRRAARRIRSALASKVLILLYHRVAELPSDPQLLAVTPARFAEQLDCLRRHVRVLSLQQLSRALREGSLPHRAAVVTFDDGYADNLHNAKPLLERFDVPATVFVASGFVGQDRECWWDELERLLLQPGRVPETLHLKVNGRICDWMLGEASHYSDESYWEHRFWNVEKDDPSERQRLYRSLCPLMRPLPDGERRDLLEKLLAWSGAAPIGRPTHKTLSPEEVVSLGEGNLVEIGAHTVTHPVLSGITAEIPRAEIKESKSRLEEILGRPVLSFAYPYGTRSDYSRETVHLVRQAGFESTCSNFPGWVRKDANPYELPRYLVRDWDGEEFSRRLRAWLHG